MIVYNFNQFSTPIAPNETDAPLCVDADAMLIASTALQRFQFVSGRR
jgi:hypothetical protein